MSNPIKIVIFGAESTGKTWLASALAKFYETVWVPEFARYYLQEKFDRTGEICSYDDLMTIAKGQVQWEKDKIEETNKDIIFCDTNPLQTYYYGKAYFPNFNHPELWDFAMEQKYDYYFLTYIDVPWEADDLRDKPNEREEMHRLFRKALEENNLPYSIIKGSKEERLQTAIETIKTIKK